MKDSHQDITTQIYDSNAGKYKKATQDFSFPGNMFESFLDKLIGKKILDVGCAYGRDILKLHRKGYDVRGLEISRKLIEEADEEIRDFIDHGDMTELETIYTHENFDGIISSASLVHMDKDIGIHVMKQIYKLLKNGGSFYLSIKVDVTPKSIFKESLSTSGSVKKYVYYGENEIEDILRNIGFSITKTHIWKPTDDSWKIVIAQK